VLLFQVLALVGVVVQDGVNLVVGVVIVGAEMVQEQRG
jgi:hypothetical protein